MGTSHSRLLAGKYIKDSDRTYAEAVPVYRRVSKRRDAEPGEQEQEASDKEVHMSLASHKRILVMTGEVDSDLTSEVITKLGGLTARSNAPIVLYISSPGGAIHDAFAIYDAIKACPADIAGIATGVCWSSATLILQACDRRLITPNASLMMHAGSIAISEASPEEGLADALAYYRDQQRFTALLRSHTNAPKTLFQEWNSKAKYFLPEEALKYNLVDAIYTGKTR